MEHLQTGKTLQGGKYRIEKVLGNGGFGITYLAAETGVNKQVAIKELFLQGVNERTAGDSSTVIISNTDNTIVFEQQKNKFEKEARRISELNNEHIVKVYDFFEENDTAYYVMDYVEGRSLLAISKEQQLTEQQVNGYLEQLLNALLAIHERHIWHLDIKPANILVDSEDRLVLIDFGASKHIEQGGHLTTSSAMAYTPGFAPPEQMQGSMEKFGPWTDFYALGATLYQVMTRHTPPSFADILSEGEKAFDFPSGMSRELQKKIIWMMKPNRKERPQSIDDFYVQSEQTIMSSSTQTVMSSSATQTIMSSSAQTVVQSAQPSRKSNKSYYVLGIIGLLILIVCVCLFAISRQASQSSEDVIMAEADLMPAYNENVSVVSEEPIEETVEQPLPSIRRWDGTYVAEYCAGDTYGGTSICFTTTIELWSMNDTENYSGTITVEGWQTAWSASVEGTAFDDNSIKIWISSEPEGLGGLSTSDNVARFYYNSNSNTYSANWFGPMQECQYVEAETGIGYTPSW